MQEEKNWAKPTGEVFQQRTNEEYQPEKEQLYFELRDKYHTFYIGLRDMLCCIKFAEEQGELPEHGNWWLAVAERYDIPLEPVSNEEN